MSVQDLWKVSQVSQTLHIECQCSSMWRKLCLNDFGDDPPIIFWSDTERSMQRCRIKTRQGSINMFTGGCLTSVLSLRMIDYSIFMRFITAGMVVERKPCVRGEKE